MAAVRPLGLESFGKELLVLSCRYYRSLCGGQGPGKSRDGAGPQRGLNKTLNKHPVS